MNWTPITLTSVLYRNIFGRISREFMRFDDKNGKTIFAINKKVLSLI
jgi:hypothetical protein